MRLGKDDTARFEEIEVCMESTQHPSWYFIDEQGTFELKDPQENSYLYFPLVNQAGMMSSLTPNLNGDPWEIPHVADSIRFPRTDVEAWAETVQIVIDFEEMT